MEGFAAAAMLAMLPAAGNIAGGLLTTVVRVPEQRLAIPLHAAAGVLLAVICVELVPTALAATVPWVVITAFFVGGVAFLALDSITHIAQRRLGRAVSASTVAVFSAVAIDLFTDGLMIGSGTTVTTRLGFLLALGQVPADIPEGFASVSSLAAHGWSRARLIVWSTAFALPIFFGTTVGYFAVRSAPELMKLSLLAFSAGMLLTVIMEELVPEAHSEDESRWAVFALLGGFCLFALLSAYLS